MGDSQTGEHLYHRSLPTGVKVLSPTSGFQTWGSSNLGVWQREEEFLENQNLKASGIWLQDFDWTGGNGDSTIREHTQSSVYIGTQGKEQWPHRRLKQIYLLVLEGLLQRQGVTMAHCEDKDTGSRSSGKYSLAWELPESAISPTKEEIGSSDRLLRSNNQKGGNPTPPISRQAD